MSMFLRRARAALLRLAGSLHARQIEQDLSDELETHLAMHIQDNLNAGMPAEEARRQALIKLGGIQSTRQAYRDRRGVPVLETTAQDLRYAVRTLGKNPGFTLVAVATLALGIAANTTIFSMVSGILLRKPPIADPDRVMIITSADKSNPNPHSVAAPDYLDWTEQSHVFQEMGASTSRDVTLTGRAEPTWVAGMAVTEGYFPSLGVPPAMGRTFFPEECRPGHERVIVLSHRIWLSHFNADPAIIGGNVALDGERYTVIGVMPPQFRLNIFDAALWTPLVFTPDQVGPNGRARPLLSVIGRLKASVSLQQAQAEIGAISRRLEERYPVTNKNRSARVMTLEEFMIRDANVRPALLVLMGAVIFVLLIGCSNIANLLLARNATRQRELVIRAAVGAGRFRLIRQLLAESLVMGVAGGGMGLLLSLFGMQLLRSQLTWNDYVQVMGSEMTLDRTVLGFCMLISLLAAGFFGLLPALEASKLDLNGVLNEGSRGGSSGIARRRLRAAFVVGEIALSIILLVGAGVMIQAFYDASQKSLGFHPEGVLTAEARLSSSRYKEPAQQSAFFKAAMDNAAGIPGVESSAVTSDLPANGTAGRASFRLAGLTYSSKDQEPRARQYVTSAGYLRTMGIPLIKGRDLLASDSMNAPRVVVVNETFARRFFPNQEAIGQRISIDTGEADAPSWSEIVGVAGDVWDFLGQLTLDPQIYESYLQRPQSSMLLMVHARSQAAAIAPLLRQAIWTVDKDQPVGAVQTMTTALYNSGAGDRLMAWLMGTFAALALVLAGVGIFGVIAYTVAQRTREVGIRMAMGAGKREVMGLVLGHSARLTGLGVGLGLLGAFRLPNLLGSLFNGLIIDPTPLLASVAALVAFVALLASYVPARRAMRVEPLEALRHD